MAYIRSYNQILSLRVEYVSFDILDCFEIGIWFLGSVDMSGVGYDVKGYNLKQTCPWNVLIERWTREGMVVEALVI